MVKKGDTLVEVAIAIGIFSMVAIAVASVMNSSTSDAQLALETTLTREEIDAQAEALRFIHDSYASNKQSTNQSITKLWHKIASKAINVKDDLGENTDPVLQYAPTSCANLFDNDDIRKNAFVINTRKLSEGTDAFVGYDPELFLAPSTYPRLVFSDSEGESLYNASFNTDISSVEGLYVIAVTPEDEAYYDFYIRTCWYGGGTSDASTISTVIRLYNSDQLSPEKTFYFTATLHGLPSYGNIDIPRTKKLKFSDYTDTKSGYALTGWCTQPTNNEHCSGDTYDTEEAFYSTKQGQHYDFYAIWRPHYWFDVNVFLNDRNSGTSGQAGFSFRAYVNGKNIKCGDNSYAKCDSNRAGDDKLKDLYQEVPDGYKIKLVFLKVPGYYISNASSICNKLGAKCSVKETASDYTVELVMDPDGLSADKDSSGHYAVQIEPIWKKR